MSIIDFDDAKRKKELPERPAHHPNSGLTILDVYMAWIQTMTQPTWPDDPVQTYTVTYSPGLLDRIAALSTEIPKTQTWVQLELDLGE